MSKAPSLMGASKPDGGARYSVRVVQGQTGPIAHVWDNAAGEYVSTYSRRCYGADFKTRAAVDVDRMNREARP